MGAGFFVLYVSCTGCTAVADKCLIITQLEYSTGPRTSPVEYSKLLFMSVLSATLAPPGTATGASEGR